MITWTFLSAFLGAAFLLIRPAGSPVPARWIALIAAAAGFAVAVGAFVLFDRGGAADPFQFVVHREWIPGLGISFHLGADGISVVLLLLTGLVGITGVLFSWNIDRAPNEFFAWFLLIIGGAYGVFLSLDLFLFVVFLDIVIIPKYLLIARWGSTNREYGAMKLTLYSFAGSLLVLLVAMAVYVVAGRETFSLLELTAVDYPASFQMFAFPVMFLGFAVLAGIWPFHTWAPIGHVAAPTAASMLLAGVVMKLGAYGALRVAMPLFPEGLEQWSFVFALLAAVGIFYGASAALAQKDLKFVIGYSSVAHMGFVLLGLMTLNVMGLTGAVYQMFSHGIIAGLLFGVVGRMVYDRTHTRELSELGPMALAKALPFAAFTFVVASAASMGVPGFSGFIAEISVIIGVLDALPSLLFLVLPGLVVTVAFSLYALQSAFFGNRPSTEPPATFPDPISRPERIAATILIVVALLAGVYPQPFLELIFNSFEHEPLRSLIVLR